MKKCSKCKVEKESYKFSKDKRSKDGLNGKCEVCLKECRKQWRQANKERVKEYNKEYRKVNKEKAKEYRKVNKEYQKKYQQANKDKFKEYRKKYYENNKGKIKERKKEYQKNKRKNDPFFKLKCYLGSRTAKAFRNMRYKKTSKTQEILGVNWEVCKLHIERQFTKGMNWDNYGQWQIDHIIPIASANDEKQLLKLCHYSNLQPLWAKDNLSKRDKIVECQVKLRI